MDVVARPAPGRDVGPFDDITSVRVVETRWEPNGWLRVTFDGNLDADTRWLVEQRITSPTATDEQRRVALWRATKQGATNLAAMHVAYTLGMPMPAAITAATATATAKKATSAS